MSRSTSEESSISLNHLLNQSRYDLENDHIEYDYRMADTLSSTILHLWSSSTDCDLVFLISHRRYYAHSYILLNVCRSLKNNLTQQKSSPIKFIYPLKVTTYSGLELVLIYIYTSRLILNVRTISDLYIASNELDVEHITQRCIHFMNESIQKMYDKSEEVGRMDLFFLCHVL